MDKTQFFKEALKSTSFKKFNNSIDNKNLATRVLSTSSLFFAV